MNIALIVEYDGTDFNGFQYQPDFCTIQGELEIAIEKFLRSKIRIKAAGRTDSGVHAKAQIITFRATKYYSLNDVVGALNYYLPKAISIHDAVIVSDDFDPRRDAYSRHYRYTMYCGDIESPLNNRMAFKVPVQVNVELMEEAAKFFRGIHDFKNFGKISSRDKTDITIREIYQSILLRQGEWIFFNIEGNSFLTHQVRMMAGALLCIGKETLTLDNLKDMVDGNLLKQRVVTLPPNGLCLVKVRYPDHLLRYKEKEIEYSEYRA